MLSVFLPPDVAYRYLTLNRLCKFLLKSLKFLLGQASWCYSFDIDLFIYCVLIDFTQKSFLHRLVGRVQLSLCLDKGMFYVLVT